MDRNVIFKQQFVQPGLGTTQTKTGGELKSLWIEIPAWCDLYCPYCFASTNHSDYDSKNLRPEEYESIIADFANLGGKDIGIPGSGEPFHRRPNGLSGNRELMLKILDMCKEYSICLTIFTTAHHIDSGLAKILYDNDVVLLVKCNSLNIENQNWFVGNPKHINYAKERNNVLLNLMHMGFNEPAFGKKSRLGIVTSVMNRNKNELPSLLRFARRHNIIFDCDTVLEVGRGKSFDDDGGSPPDDEMKLIFTELQAIDAIEFGNYWHISRSYVGTCCDRFRHHLYMTKNGNVYPCIGARKVLLGNVRKNNIRECWDNELMQIIRNHEYNGKCSTCLNYLEGKCYSCLGRCTVNLSSDQLKQDGHVKTIGCWNNRPEADEDNSSMVKADNDILIM